MSIAESFVPNVSQSAPELELHEIQATGAPDKAGASLRLSRGIAHR
jgi:hypothetical protein